MVLASFICDGQDANYSGKYKVVSSQGGELEVIQNGSTATIVFKGDRYECEVGGNRIAGYAVQRRNFVGRFAQCYDRIMADPEKAQLFRKFISISFDDLFISGMTQAPLLECVDEETARVLEGDIKTLMLSYNSNDLLWITKTGIYRCNIENPSQRVEVVGGLSKGSNVAVDQEDDFIFYSDGGDIWSVKLDGSDKKKIISLGFGMEIKDWLSIPNEIPCFGEWELYIQVRLSQREY